MHTFSIVTAAFAASCVASALPKSAPAKTSQQLCAEKNQGAIEAIAIFCRTQNIMVPSYYSTVGANDPTFSTQVSIHGNCKPAQWVPQHFCFSQFYDMCASGGKHGANIKRFGANGSKCQQWQIAYGDMGPGLAPPKHVRSLEENDGELDLDNDALWADAEELPDFDLPSSSDS